MVAALLEGYKINGHINVFLSLSIPFLSVLPLRFGKDAFVLPRAVDVPQGRYPRPLWQGKYEKGRKQGAPCVRANYVLLVVGLGVGFLGRKHPTAPALDRRILLPELGHWSWLQ